MEERRAVVLTHKERLDQFEVADGDLVEFKGSAVFLEFQAVNVLGIDFLRGAHVVEDGAGGDGGRGMMVETEALQRADI